MPIRGFSVASSSAMESEVKITFVVIFSCIMAATGGLMFGYDVGISGGVISMDHFLMKFFPKIYEEKMNHQHSDNNYCLFNNQYLQLFTSSLYFAGIIATFFASYTTRYLGRQITIRISGVFFIVGVVLGGAAQNLTMLIMGRIILGCGVGFANQAVPLYLSEIAPARMRGGLNILFQLNITIGILFANLVNYGTNKIDPWGWRLSLSFAGIPAVLFTLGSIIVDDTPNSLIERGHLEKGKTVLRKFYGTDNIETELNEILEASRVAQQVKHPFRELLRRHNRPPLTMAIFFEIFQQLTGINVIMLYSPVILSSLGFLSDTPFYSAIILGSVNVLSTLISIYLVDKVGRRFLLLEAGVQMLFSLVVICVLLGKNVTTSDSSNHRYAILVLVMIGTFVSSFAWSWGPLGWLIPSETFRLETRAAGQSVAVCFNLAFTSLIAQSTLSMLCTMKFGIFVFFSGWVMIMTIFVLWFVPETENVPIEEMSERVWKKHWYWKRFMDGEIIPKPNQ